ncbi:NAD(P)-binding protein, partial [Mesorhizobium sp. M7D.F.Ca.US.004.03.1.1]|uniref:NAD(P)-binding protein n=1 Tax=Mesorhizobium sp. M7D.F.Ca.US.004.03.1.1 TaxID=2496702 RepID=UPI0013E3068E
MGLGHAPYADVAKSIREHVSVPTIHGTRINNADTAERLLRSGAADFAGMCRALIADPHLPNKYRTGRAAETNPCVGCEQACIGHLASGQPISCVGNPITGREAALGVVEKAAIRRRIVVVGAGPAGLECSWIAARGGHDVVLLERDHEVGGLLRLAAKAPDRAEWLDLIDHKHHLARINGVDIRVGADASVAMISELEPDLVVLATGTSPCRSVHARDDAANIFDHREILCGKGHLGRRVAVLDGDNHQQGVTTAYFLASPDRHVT